jgi:hypothetical protein
VSGAHPEMPAKVDQRGPLVMQLDAHLTIGALPHFGDRGSGGVVDLVAPDNVATERPVPGA